MSEALDALEILHTYALRPSGSVFKFHNLEVDEHLKTIRAALSEISLTANSESGAVSELVQEMHELDHIADAGKMVAPDTISITDSVRVWPIDTDDQVEALAKECGWENRKYMTPKDYAWWCEHMRMFVCLATLSQPAPPVVSPHSKGESGEAREPGMGWKLSDSARGVIDSIAHQNVRNAAALGNTILGSPASTPNDLAGWETLVKPIRAEMVKAGIDTMRLDMIVSGVPRLIRERDAALSTQAEVGLEWQELLGGQDELLLSYNGQTIGETHAYDGELWAWSFMGGIRHCDLKKEEAMRQCESAARSWLSPKDQGQ